MTMILALFYFEKLYTVIKYLTIFLFVPILFLLLSCSSDNDKNISTYPVTYKDFENILTVDGYVEPIRSTTLSCPRFIDGIVQFLIEDGTYVEEGDVVCRIEFQDLQNQYDQLLLELENAEARLNTTKADLDMQYAMLETQVRSNEADTKIAQLDSLQLTYSPENQKKVKELQLEKTNIEKVKYQNKLKTLSVIQQSEIKRQEIEIQQLSNRVKSTKEQLDGLTLKAPKKGLATRPIYPVTNEKLKIGDNVWGNMPIIVIPEMEEVKVKIMASERDYKYISIGDSVRYTFDAMPGNNAWGRILSKAPVGQPMRNDSKVKFFEIEASVDSMQSLPEPGFTVNCHISLKQIKDTIVVPQIAIFEEDSMKVVYVKKNNKFELRQILTGITSPKEAIVSNGLKGNEIISLSKPKPSLIKDRILLPDSIRKSPNK